MERKEALKRRKESGARVTLEKLKELLKKRHREYGNNSVTVAWLLWHIMWLEKEYIRENDGKIDREFLEVLEQQSPVFRLSNKILKLGEIVHKMLDNLNVYAPRLHINFVKELDR